MKFSCPQCQQSLDADEALIGQSVDCPQCGHAFIVQPPKGKVAPKSAAPRKKPGPPPPQKPRPPTSLPSTEPRGGSGFGVSLLVAAVVVAAGLGVAMLKFNESPQQLWQRLVGTSASTPAPDSTPAPEPMATAQPPATPPPIATPQPMATPVPAATPAPDRLAWLLEHREAWPKEVVLSKEAEFPVVFNGRVSGTAKVPAGTAVELVEFSADAVGVVFRGGGARLPIDVTDLRQRAQTAMASASANAMVVTEPTKAPAKATAATPAPAASTFPTSGSLIAVTVSGQGQTVATLVKRRVTLTGAAALHVTGTGDPLADSVINFTSPDAWLFMDNIKPSAVAANFVSRMWVQGAPAALDANMRILQYGKGAVVIPHGDDFAAMTVFDGKSLTGASMPLQCFTNYNDATLGSMKGTISSFRLKRGYMATIAQKEDGTGVSKNYVAQDQDIEVKTLPGEFDGNISFVRIFPWRFTNKKGIAGGIWEKLNVGWFYDWNIGANSSPDLEYVPIKQKRHWPGLKQDWKRKGATHLLGYNEPDHKDQANLKVDDAIAGWPELLGTGLRLGSPAVSDGGLGWLYEFMDKADKAKLRVDFVAVHYYRAVPPKDAKRAAAQFHSFVKGIYDRTKRPIWITEWNNGANWTNAGDPNEREQKEAIEEMIKMLDETPFVERYALYNWVEDCRSLLRKDGSLTPAGEVYRDKVSPLSYTQAKP